MKFLEEFKAFALRGNVMDMAVGVIIGGAFQKIISSIVNDILMPPLGMLFGKSHFGDLAVTLNPARVAQGADPVLWRYGSFIQTCFDFLILAFCVFIMVKAISLLRKDPAPDAPPAPTKDQELLTEIRDLLKKK